MFELQLRAVWIPGVATWASFRADAQTRLTKQLARYRKEVNEIWGSGSPKFAEHAIWTVLWQRGKSPGWIKHNRKLGSEANVQMRVHEFAKAIGLPLRKSHVGPKARM